MVTAQQEADESNKAQQEARHLCRLFASIALKVKRLRADGIMATHRGGWGGQLRAHSIAPISTSRTAVSVGTIVFFFQFHPRLTIIICSQIIPTRPLWLWLRLCQVWVLKRDRSFSRASFVSLGCPTRSRIVPRTRPVRAVSRVKCYEHFLVVDRPAGSIRACKAALERFEIQEEPISSDSRECYRSLFNVSGVALRQTGRLVTPERLGLRPV